MFSDLTGLKINHRQYLTARQRFTRIICCLGNTFSCPDDRPEIYCELVSRDPAAICQISGDDSADANVNLLEQGEINSIGLGFHVSPSFRQFGGAASGSHWEFGQYFAAS